MKLVLSLLLIVLAVSEAVVASASERELGMAAPKREIRMQCEVAKPAQGDVDPVTESEDLQGQAAKKEDGKEEQCTVAFAD